MQKEVGKGKNTLLSVKLSKKERGKLCNIYLSFQRKDSGDRPCARSHPGGQMKLVSLPQITTTVLNLAQLRL